MFGLSRFLSLPRRLISGVSNVLSVIPIHWHLFTVQYCSLVCLPEILNPHGGSVLLCRSVIFVSNKLWARSSSAFHWFIIPWSCFAACVWSDALTGSAPPARSSLSPAVSRRWRERVPPAVSSAPGCSVVVSNQFDGSGRCGNSFSCGNIRILCGNSSCIDGWSIVARSPSW